MGLYEMPVIRWLDDDEWTSCGYKINRKNSKFILSRVPLRRFEDLDNSTAVMLFVDSRNKKYRKFYQQLNKLSFEDQLAAINYIIFAYSENVFMSKTLSDELLSNKNFIEVCKKSSMVESTKPYDNDFLETAKKSFDLLRRNDIPNLLSKRYALNYMT